MVNPCVEKVFSKEEIAEVFGEGTFTDEAILDRLLKNAQSAEGLSRQAKLKAVRIDAGIKYMRAYAEDFPAKKNFLGKTSGGEVEALGNLIGGSWFSRAGTTSVARHIDAVLGAMHSRLGPMLKAYMPKKLGLGAQAGNKGARNMVREMFQQSTGDADAKAFAKMWTQTMDEFRVRFNRAGGLVDDLETWALPQFHMPSKVGKASYAEWEGYIRSKLDLERTFGRMEIDPGSTEYHVMMERIYNKIRTDGLSELRPGEVPPWVRGAIGQRHQEARMFHFKGGDEWLDYQAKFGSDDIYSTMTSHMSMMAREIGLMEKLGPNPDFAYRYLKDIAMEMSGKKTGFQLADAMWKNVSGQTFAHDIALAQTMQSFRNISVGLKLGSSTLSAIPDVAFQGITANFNEMSVTRLMGRFIKNLGTGTEDKEFAVRLGFVADYAMDIAAAASRYAEVTGYGKSARFVDAVIRGAGLNHWTIAGKVAFQLEFLHNLARWSGKEWQHLSPKVRAAMERYGINKKDWNKIRTVKTKYDGGEYINPTAFGDRDLQARVTAMVIEEASFAVPEPNIRTRAILNQGLATGTIAGEMLRAFGSLKSFAVTIMTTHWGRMLGAKGTQRYAYMASLIGGTTVLGGVSLQAKNLAMGKGFEDWTNSDFAVRALDQGAILGLLGDFILKDVNDYQFSLFEDLAGPVLNDFSDVVFSFGWGSMQDLMSADKKFAENLAAKSGRALQQYTPGRMWWNKLLMDRFVFDWVRENTDKNWPKKQRQKEREMRREKGQRYWYPPS